MVRRTEALRGRAVAGSGRELRRWQGRRLRGARCGDAYFSGSEAFARFRGGGFLWCWGSALAHGFVHDDGTGDGDVEGGDLASHRDAKEMVTGFLDEVVEAGAFASEDENAVGFEVEVGVVGCAAFVEADDPDVFLLELLEGAD